ncbi:hypothetical protein RND81_04G119500 [Saponaria officinalis]|uniref:Uncharacterized protein n=1 Tax=Saponaria officinalis TaxID=3572 RepID=A0AAW1LL87_SAPOF
MAEQYDFKLINSTPYDAHANGEAESTNKIIKNGIARMIKDNPREWSNLLLDILWAYRTSKRDAIDCTPYELVYGHEAIIPVEVGVRIVRVDGQRHTTSEAYEEAMSIMNLDVEAKRAQALNSLIKQKKLTMESYNKQVRIKSFKVDDLVWKVRLPTGRKDHFYGKWTPQWEGPFRVIKVYSGCACGPLEYERYLQQRGRIAVPFRKQSDGSILLLEWLRDPYEWTDKMIQGITQPELTWYYPSLFSVAVVKPPTRQS